MPLTAFSPLINPVSNTLDLRRTGRPGKRKPLDSSTPATHPVDLNEKSATMANQQNNPGKQQNQQNQQGQNQKGQQNQQQNQDQGNKQQGQRHQDQKQQR